MSGKVGATCSSLELQVAPPAFTDTDEWASMKQFEKLATQAIRIEFPNSTNAIRQVDRLGGGCERSPMAGPLHRNFEISIGVTHNLGEQIAPT